MYLYKSHLGGVYLTKKCEKPEFCDQCGDIDDYLFHFEDIDEFLDALEYEKLSIDLVIDILKDIANYEDNKPYIKAFISRKEEEISEIKEEFKEIL